MTKEKLIQKYGKTGFWLGNDDDIILQSEKKRKIYHSNKSIAEKEKIWQEQFPDEKIPDFSIKPNSKKEITLDDIKNRLRPEDAALLEKYEKQARE
jgi:hypothetical protein